MVRIRQKLAAETVLPVLPTLPGWARGDGPVTDTDADSGADSRAAFQAGAALAMLDGRVRAGGLARPRERRAGLNHVRGTAEAGTAPPGR